MRKRILNGEKLRLNVFWQFFSSFFVLILMPSIIACLFTYVYVVNIIENEVEESSGILVGHFAEMTDELVDVLRNDMIKLLSYTSVENYIRYNDSDAPPSQAQIDIKHALTNQINSLAQNHPLVHSAYLVPMNKDEVVSSLGGALNKELFFRYMNDMSSPDNGDLSRLFSGKKMMELTNPLLIHQKNLYIDRILTSDTLISAVMSYPFNSNYPSAYLVVNIDADQLASQIAIRDADVIETAILNEDGHIMAYAGARRIDGEDLLQAYRSSDGQSAHLLKDGLQLQVTFDYSESYRWIYVSMSDLDKLRQPAELIRHASIALLLFFCLIGAVLSYMFSRKMYLPIQAIKLGLASHRNDDRSGNEFELIKHWSESIMSENKDMSLRIDGMSPIMHEYFLSKVLLGEFRDELSVSIYAREIGFDARPNGNMATLCIEVDFHERSHVLTETDKSFLIIDLKSKIERRLNGPVWLCQTRSDLLACIVHLPDDSSDREIYYAEELKQLLEQQADYFHSAIGVGTTVRQVSELHHSYVHAIRLLKRKGLHDQVEICRDGADEEARMDQDSFLSTDKVNQMLSLYQSGRYALMQEKVNELIDAAVSNKASAETVKQLCVDILNTWLRATVEDHKEDFSIEQHSDLLKRLKGCITAGDLRLFFEEVAGELFGNKMSSPEINDFTDIVQYIETNYHQELGIEQFALQLNMSVGHFSRSFKEAVGEKYIDFLTRCRMEAAKQLLIGTDMKIDDIATQVGYLGRHSFIRIFNKYEGTTPGKFRMSKREVE